MALYSHILATGSYVPEHAMGNDELEKLVDTTDEWIFQRSGIKTRHIAAKDQPTSDLAIRAAKDALDSAGLNASDIDGIIVATTTPDNTFPAVAVTVQAALGVNVCIAFDVQAVCTGFVYALSVADNFIKVGQLKRVLVIGAEKMSAVLDWSDRSTCVLFGDGAGAIILEARTSDTQENGVFSTHLYANGNLKELLYTNGGVSTTGQSGHIIMQGREVFKHAVGLMAGAVEAALEKNNLKAEDVDWLVPHQANIRIIEATAKKLNMPMEKVIVTVQNHGNTSAASIPLAFDYGVKSNKIKRGEIVLMEAMGGGITWGSALLRY